MTTDEPTTADVAGTEPRRLQPAGMADEHLPEGEEAPPPGVRIMGVVRWGLVLLMALAAFASLRSYYGWFGGAEASASETTYYCPMHPGVQQDYPGDCPICNMTLVPKVDADAGPAAAAGQYYCPMHPHQTSDDPEARCPECGMRLEPKPVEPAAAQTAGATATQVPGLVPIDLSSDRIQLAGLRTATVTRAVLAPHLRTVGTVTANERGLAVIQTRFSGWIEQLFVDQTGQKVTRGQVLATIYSPELLQAQQEFLIAQRWAKTPGAVAVTGLDEDARRRLELLGIAKRDIDDIARTGEPLRAMKVRSPVTGHVIGKAAVQGMAVQPGTALFELADLSTVWVIAAIYEHEAARVKEGQPAVIELQAYPGEKLTGKLTFIYPSLDSDTRTLRVRMEFKNPALRLKPGMYGDVSLELERTEVLVVPAEAVVDTGELQYVFLAREGGRFEPRRIRIGARDGQQVQVLDGVAEGEVVVTTGNFLVDSESRLRATIEGQGETGGAGGPADFCAANFDPAKYPDKHQQCRACVAHRGMGTMEDDCRNAIPRPWK